MIPWIRVLPVGLLIAGACGGTSPPAAPDAVAVVVDSLSDARVVARASFVRTGYAVTGTVAMRRAGEVVRLEFSRDFSIAQTPGPFVYLSNNSNPNRGVALRVASLTQRTGEQQYTFRVPAGNTFTHVLIWCDPFNVGMAEAVLMAVP